MFISNAWAQTAGGAEQQLLGFLPIILMFVVLYFLMIRPQMKRAKEHKPQLAEALASGARCRCGCSRSPLQRAAGAAIKLGSTPALALLHHTGMSS